MSRAILVFVSFIACSVTFSVMPVDIKFQPLGWSKRTLVCESGNLRYNLLLLNSPTVKRIVVEQVSNLFKSTVLLAELSDEFYFQVDPQFNNIFRDSVDVIKSFHSIFFPETLNCCYYMTTDGFHVTYDKKIGVKFLNGSTVFRLYSGSNGIFEIEDSASKIVVKHGSQTLKCEQAT